MNVCYLRCRHGLRMSYMLQAKAVGVTYVAYIACVRSNYCGCCTRYRQMHGSHMHCKRGLWVSYTLQAGAESITHEANVSCVCVSNTHCEQSCGCYVHCRQWLWVRHMLWAMCVGCVLVCGVHGGIHCILTSLQQENGVGKATYETQTCGVFLARHQTVFFML